MRLKKILQRLVVTGLVGLTAAQSAQANSSGVITIKSPAKSDKCKNLEREQVPDCGPCEEEEYVPVNSSKSKKTPSDTCDESKSFVNSLSGSYMDKFNESARVIGGEGCAPCGSSSSKTTVAQLNLTRNLISRRSHRVWDLGIGQATNIDIRLTLMEDAGGSLTIYKEVPQADFGLMYIDGSAGDTRDGIFHGSHFNSTVEMHLLDANDNVVLNYTDAVKIRYIDFEFTTFEYEVIALSGSDYAGRLVSVKNLRGHGYDVTYKTWTAAQIAADPALQWQRDTVTDSTGRIFTFNYHASPVGGEYVISSITLPNSSVINYAYTSNYLSKVTYPDNSESTYSYSVDADGDTVLHSEETGGKVKDIYMTSAVSDLSSTHTDQIMWNQDSMGVGTVKVNGEITFAYFQDLTRLNRAYIYTGEGSMKYREIDRTVRFFKNFTYSTDGNGDITKDLISGPLEDKYLYRREINPNGTEYPSVIKEPNGTECSYKYDKSNRLVFKSYSDNTFEAWSYNNLNLVTRYRDRLGRVTLKTYDAQGNLLTREVGILDSYTGLASDYNVAYWNGGNLTQVSGATASQSTNNGNAARAIDGNTNGKFFLYSTTLTQQETMPWWKVNLVRSSLINSVKVYNRKEEPQRLADFTVSLYNGATLVHQQTFIPAVPSEGMVEVIPPAGTYADSVQVQLNGTDYLSLAEVEVFGVDTVADAQQTGADTVTSEHATYTNEYYPTGHVNEHLLRYKFDANNNRTEYLYDVNQRLIQINEPDDSGSGYHARSTLTYTASGLLSSSTDAVGRITNFEYDSRERQIKATYNDGSTELIFYGTGKTADLVVKTKDRNGNTTTFEYDDAARVIKTIQAYSVMNTAGTSETVNPTSLQSVIEKTYLNGHDVPRTVKINGDLTEYTYDFRERVLTTKRYADSNSILINTNEYRDNKLYSTEDPYGRKTYRYYRDSDAALTRTIQQTMPGAWGSTRDLSNNAAYLITDFELDAEGQQTALVDPRGIRHETDYDSRGRTTFQVSAHGTTVAATTQMLYDANSNIIETRSPRYFSESINARTTNVYTRRNMLANRTVAAGSAIAATESFTYYDDGRAKDHTDFRGNTSTTVWHQCCGRLQAKIDRSGHQSVSNNDFYSNVTHTAVVDAAGTINNYHDLPAAATVQEVTTRFDSRHRPIATTAWLDPLGLVDPNNVPIAGDTGVTQNGLTTQILYFDETTGHAELVPLLNELAADGISFNSNADGSAVIRINPAGEVSIAIMDGVGRTVASGMYDKTDWVNNVYTLVTWNTVIHDTVTNNLLETQSLSALNHSNKSFTDGAGRRRNIEDSEGKQTSLEYDANSNLIKSRDANGIGHDYVFDELNRNIQCTDTQGDVTKKEYDLNNNIIKLTDVKLKNVACSYDERDRQLFYVDRLGANTTYGYDANNNLTSITDALSKITSYEYDVRNLQIKVTYADSGVTQCNYDALRRKKVCTDQLTDTVTYNYDLASRLLSREYYTGGTTLESTDVFTYDEASRVLTAHKGRYDNICSYSYDGIGRQKTETFTVDGNSYTITHSYDADNRPINCAYSAGNTVTKTWTSRNQLLTTKFNAGDIADFTYDNGMREATRTFGNALVATQTYRNDNTKLSISVAGKNDLSFTYGYDANKNVTAETSTGTIMAGYSWTAGFDDEDRVISWNRSNSDSQAWTLDLIGNWSNTTGSLGGSSFNESRTHNDTHELAAIDSNSVAYDAKGNMISDANGKNLVWDIDNHLNSFNDGVNTTEFTYDALGRRVSKGDIYFICDGQRVVEEYEKHDTEYFLARSYTHASYVDDITAKVETNTEVYQAEDAALVGAVIYTDTHLPGGSYVDYNFVSGESITWTINVTDGGNQNLDFGYGFGKTGRPMDLYVDGVYSTTITFPTTGDWDVWDEYRHVLNLGTGTHTIKLESTVSDGGPNIDYLRVTPENPEIHYYHTDRQFNVRGLTDDSGNTLELYAYSVYGQQIILDPATITQLPVSGYANNYGFTGRYLDSNIGLWYFRARYFSDEMGRFISRDPLGYVDGMSLYNGYFGQVLQLDPNGTDHKVTHDEGSCEVTMTIEIEFDFQRAAFEGGVDDVEYKEKFINSVEKMWNRGTFRIFAAKKGYEVSKDVDPDCWVECPCYEKGWLPKVKLSIIEDASTIVIVDPNKKRAHATLGAGEIHINVDDDGTVMAHEIGHIMGIHHPGQDLDVKPEPNSHEDYAPDMSAIMGAGNELRSQYFAKWAEHLDSSYPKCSPFSTKQVKLGRGDQHYVDTAVKNMENLMKNDPDNRATYEYALKVIKKRVKELKNKYK